jgi:hypothetical protein
LKCNRLRAVMPSITGAAREESQVSHSRDCNPYCPRPQTSRLHYPGRIPDAFQSASNIPANIDSHFRPFRCADFIALISRPLKTFRDILMKLQLAYGLIFSQYFFISNELVQVCPRVFIATACFSGCEIKSALRDF